MNRSSFIKNSFFGLLGIPVVLSGSENDEAIQVLMDWGFTRAEAMKLKRRILELGNNAMDHFNCRSEDQEDRRRGKWVMDFEGKPLVECTYKVGMNKSGRCMVECTKWRKCR